MSILCGQGHNAYMQNSRLHCYLDGVVCVGVEFLSIKLTLSQHVNLDDTLCKSNTWHITANFIHRLHYSRNWVVTGPATIVAVQLPQIVTITIVLAITVYMVNKWPRIWGITHNASTVISSF